jgi:hypothetical protein
MILYSDFSSEGVPLDATFQNPGTWNAGYPEALGSWRYFFWAETRGVIALTEDNSQNVTLQDFRYSLLLVDESDPDRPTLKDISEAAFDVDLVDKIKIAPRTFRSITWKTLDEPFFDFEIPDFVGQPKLTARLPPSAVATERLVLSGNITSLDFP